ncbi:MAG TPA: NAD(P)-dependent oxidoreductase [Anaerolineales bacterium]|nr:NAD(P)-dependent oxidoreductase [Anaerolineales bacterium]
MRILITGAGGFIGSHLVDSQLAKGFDVRAVDLHLDLLRHADGHPHLEAVRGDITDEKLVKRLVEGVNVIYHLASAHLDVSLPDEHYRRVNVGAALSLLDAARQAGVKRFVHCSSVGVIGDVEHPPADEVTDCHPTNIYEKTKLEGERAALDFWRRTGFPVVVARPAWVYGPRCPRTAKLIRTISKGRFPIFGSGKNMRHPIYISDAVRGLELCAETPGIEGEVFILAGEEPVEARQLVRVIGEELNTPTRNTHLPILLGQWGGLALELLFKPLGKQPPFSRRSMDFFLKHNAYSIAKAKHRLNYQPQVDLRTGIQKTLAGVKNQ